MHLLLQRIIFSVAILLLPVTACMSQMDYYNNIFSRQKDSLIQVLAKHPRPDTARVNVLIKLIDCGIFLSQRKQMLPYWKEALQISRKLKYRQAEANCLEWKGSFYKSAQQTDSAFIYLDSAIAAAGNSADEWLRKVKGFSLFEKGMVYEFRENFYTALNNYFAALTAYTGMDLSKQKMISLRIADIYIKLQNDSKALEYYEAALKLYEEDNGSNANNEAEGIYALIASIYLKRGDISKAGLYLDKLKPSMPDTVETMETGLYYHLSGEIALKQKKPDTAIALLKKALKYFAYTEQVHEDNIASVNADLASLEIEKKDLIQAKKYAEQSMAAAKQSGHKETIADALTVMAAYYTTIGNQALAYNALHEASQLKDSLLAETNIKQAATLAAIYENSNKEKVITQLEADKKIQSADVKQKKLLNIIFLIAILALLFMSIMLYINFKNKQKIESQRIAELEKEKQLMSTESMLKGQEQERSRLAKDLHDGLGGMLSGVKISFSNMKENLIMDDANARAFEKSLLQLDETIAELRKVAHNLMPEALVKFGLTSAVKDFCGSMQVSSGSNIICEQFGPARELGNIADVNVYRIIQELITNAIKHGNATQVLVQLTKAAGKVFITVEDDGKGFTINNPVQTKKGIGLSNIQSRVNYLNGKFDIQSKPGEGTTANIELIA